MNVSLGWSLYKVTYINNFYSKIARDYVGCTDSEIARAAKAFGLQSNMSKHFAYKRRIVNQ